MKRNSYVDRVEVNDIAISSSFIIGDSEQILCRSYVFAVQRQKEIDYGFEGSLDPYPVYTEVIPLPPITEPVMIKRDNSRSSIHVSKVDIIGLSTSTVFQIGNTGDAYLESRIHHIRQLENSHAAPGVPNE
ncbi:spore germination protein GerPE [Heyndrickxia acidicola]|uniref:Spore germination protein GerPE n=1 Tax=Heyndrickxia acidicola TaxID=209389 RepID=A0ABU6MCT1_9BACI|nr:spore germination protein GerPE [Heyndrickxia acidicola]MED1202478.1 spore germination protein GerPE [Heyndrickxia acidicola]